MVWVLTSLIHTNLGQLGTVFFGTLIGTDRERSVLAKCLSATPV